MSNAFVVDFDGTITDGDIGFSIIKNFARSGWEKWEGLWVEKKITTPMRAEMEWDMIDAKPSEILEHVLNFKISPGFKEFCKLVNENGDKIVVASDGFNFYIDPILKQENLTGLDVVCCNLEYQDGWKFEYPNMGSCMQCGSCKKDITDGLKEEGYKVYYIGDGYSDRCGCKGADVILAKSYLAMYCQEEKIDFTPFENFNQVINILKQLIYKNK